MLRTGKRAKVVGNLLHVSSYREANILQTERQTHGWLNNTQNVVFFSPKTLVPFWLHHYHVRKDSRLSPHTRLRSGETHLTVGAFCCVQCSLPSCGEVSVCRMCTLCAVYVWTGIHRHVTRRFSGTCTLTLLTFFNASKFSHQLTSRIVNLSAGIIQNIILH